MTLSADEFIRRFLLHVLPKGFHRIRHYGLLASAGCKANIARAKELMAVPMPAVNPPASDDTVDPDVMTDHRPPCPCCGGRMIIVEVFARGSEPRDRPPAPGSGFDAMTCRPVEASVHRNISFPAPRPFHPDAIYTDGGNTFVLPHFWSAQQERVLDGVLRYAAAIIRYIERLC